MLQTTIEMYIGLIVFALLVFFFLGSMLLVKIMKQILEKRKI